MNLEILHVPDCPGLPLLLDRLSQLTDLPISTHLIEPDPAGVPGSPTLLINGKDPFATTDQPASSPTCRLYRDDSGRPTPAPTTEQLRKALSTS